MVIGLYIHIPFCAAKCGYCDFYSAPPLPGSIEPFLDALLTELHTALAQPDLRVETIFVGGGTPTHLPAPSLERLMHPLAGLVAAHDPVEFTVEANPASLDRTKAAILRRAGVTRISMGAQSFHSQELRVLERIHDPSDIPADIEVIRHAGFPHFNLDLIFGIPGQTLSSWEESLARAIELQPDHIACYGLTYEPGTPLHRRRAAGLIQPMDEETEAQCYIQAGEQLATAGFRQYEISNYARPGAESRHNLRYWLNLPGLGIGPSAASYLAGRRWRNLPDTAEYVRRIQAGTSSVIDMEELSPLDRAGETAMLGLRMVEGIDRDTFQQTTGYDPLSLFKNVIARHVAAGLIRADHSRIALTHAGRLVGDAVVADFLSPPPHTKNSPPPAQTGQDSS